MVPLIECRLQQGLNRFHNIIRYSSLDFASGTNQNVNEKTEQEPHIFKKGMTRNEIIDTLVKNIHYNKNNIIVTNKPYGVGKEKPVNPSPKYTLETLTDAYMTKILPELSKRLGVQSLHLVQTPERYASGVTILAKTDAASKNMISRIRKLKESGTYRDTYLAVVVGQLSSQLNTKFAIKLEEKENKKSYPVVVDQWPNKFSNRSNIRVFFWNHTVLSSSEHASLVKVELSNPRLNSLRLFLATKCLAPVLGDQIFGSRIVKMQNVQLLLEPNPHQKKPKYDKELMSALKLHENDVTIIPSHVHLLTKVLPFKKRVYVSVPPPESFVWTCEQLGLTLDDKLLTPNKNEDLLIESE